MGDPSKPPASASDKRSRASSPPPKPLPAKPPPVPSSSSSSSNNTGSRHRSRSHRYYYPPRPESAAADSIAGSSSAADSNDDDHDDDDEDEDEEDDDERKSELDDDYDDESEAAASSVASSAERSAAGNSVAGGNVPRNHTPGHLASKSMGQNLPGTASPPESSARRKPSEITIRQRSFSTAPPSSSKTPTGTSFEADGGDGDPSGARARTPPPVPPAPSQTASATLVPDRPESLRGRNPSTSRRRQNTSRSASSAMPGKSGHVAGSASRQPSSIVSGSRSGRTPGEHVHLPALDDPRTAPNVAPAPASGMYWSRAPVSGAPHTALRAHTTTLVGSNIFVFGGCDSRACFNQLYVLDGDSFHWSIPYVSGTVPLPLRAMTCTAVGKRLVIFGGGDGPAYYNDVYVLDTLNFRWSKPRIVGDHVPSKRRAHTACLYKNGIYVFGGGDGVRALNDIWRLDVGDFSKMSWRQVSAPDRSPMSTSSSTFASASGRELRPKPRGYHTANMVGGKLIVFGGSDGGECFQDVWVYDLDRHVWRSVEIDDAFRRLSHTATLVGSYLFVIGGHDGEEYSNEVLLLNLTTMTWERRRAYGRAPSGRGYHGTVLYDGRLIVIGGFDGSEVYGGVWMLELAVHAYYSQISHFTIDV